MGIEIINSPYTGHFDDIKRSVYVKVNNLKNSSKIKKIKIGITCDPNSRAAKYSTDGYTHMYLIYKTNSLDYVREMESYLIGNFMIHSDNYIGGGGGNFGLPPYFTYVVTKRIK
jgi:hypothetical protein